MCKIHIALKFQSDASQDTNLKYCVGEFHFSKLISHNGLRRYACRQNLISDLDREIGKQQIRIQKSLHTFLKTSPSGFKLCRGFICAVSFNMRLIRPKKHRPFRIVAPYSVYDQIKLKRNTYIYTYFFLQFRGKILQEILLHVKFVVKAGDQLDRYVFLTTIGKCYVYSLPVPLVIILT